MLVVARSCAIADSTSEVSVFSEPGEHVKAAFGSVLLSVRCRLLLRRMHRWMLVWAVAAMC